MSETRSPEEIEADIERTREELGDTVEALAAKTDVKARAHDRVDEIRGNVKAKADQAADKARAATPESARAGGQQVVAQVRAHPAPLVLGGVLLLGFVLGRRSAAP